MWAIFTTMMDFNCIFPSRLDVLKKSMISWKNAGNGTNMTGRISEKFICFCKEKISVTPLMCELNCRLEQSVCYLVLLRRLPYLLFRRKRLCSSCYISLKEITGELVNVFWISQWSSMDYNSFNLCFVFSNALDESNAVINYRISKDNQELNSENSLYIKAYLFDLFVPYPKRFFFSLHWI